MANNHISIERTSLKSKPDLDKSSQLLAAKFLISLKVNIKRLFAAVFQTTKNPNKSANLKGLKLAAGSS